MVRMTLWNYTSLTDSAHLTLDPKNSVRLEAYRSAGGAGPNVLARGSRETTADGVSGPSSAPRRGPSLRFHTCLLGVVLDARMRLRPNRKGCRGCTELD